MHEGEADLSLVGGLQGAALAGLVWEGDGLPVASGALDASFDVVGRGRSTAGIVAALSGSGSFSVGDGRINGLNPAALAAVMAAAEGDTQPDEDKARETFAQLFGSGALDMGRAAASFSITDGVMSIPTVSLSAGATAILADATFDLNRFTLASHWVVRTGEGSAEEGQPFVQVNFSGDIARSRPPDRSRSAPQPVAQSLSAAPASGAGGAAGGAPARRGGSEGGGRASGGSGRSACRGAAHPERRAGHERYARSKWRTARERPDDGDDHRPRG